MKPIITGTQIALFYKPVYIGSTVDVPSLMKQRFGKDIQITTIPISDDAPAEIPRFEIKYQNIVFSFSNLRADMIVNDNKPTDEQQINFYNVVLDFGVPIVRIGYVLKKKYENVSEQFMRDNLCLDRERFSELDEVAEATWRVNRIQKVGGGDCNNISTILLQTTDTQNNIILERDVNTVQARSDLKIITKDAVSDLITALSQQAEKTFGIQ